MAALTVAADQRVEATNRASVGGRIDPKGTSFVRLSSINEHHGPREEEPSFTDGRFDALASCLLEGLHVRKGGAVGTLSALEANDSQEDLVRRSEPSKVLLAEGPRHTPVQQSLDYLGLPHTDFQTKWSGRPII